MSKIDFSGALELTTKWRDSLIEDVNTALASIKAVEKLNIEGNLMLCVMGAAKDKTETQLRHAHTAIHIFENEKEWYTKWFDDVGNYEMEDLRYDEDCDIICKTINKAYEIAKDNLNPLLASPSK